jgi:hypothetical protein
MLRQRGAQVYQRYCFQAQPASARRIATDATITVMRTKGRGRYVRGNCGSANRETPPYASVRRGLAMPNTMICAEQSRREWVVWSTHGYTSSVQDLPS